MQGPTHFKYSEIKQVEKLEAWKCEVKKVNVSKLIADHKLQDKWCFQI